MPLTGGLGNGIGGGAPYLVTIAPASSTSPGSGGGLGFAVAVGFGAVTAGSGFASVVAVSSVRQPTSDIAATSAIAALRETCRVGASSSSCA